VYVAVSNLESVICIVLLVGNVNTCRIKRKEEPIVAMTEVTIQT
jgi:hypothetical protein